MRVLITGASGLLGANLALQYSERHDVTAVFNRNPLHASGFRSVAADLSAPGALAPLLDEAAPEIVVHCVALTDVELCEREPQLAERINVSTTVAVAQACRVAGARLLHISSDMLFDGERGRYREDDPTCPVNVYARTKLESESAAALAGDCAVVRTNIYGWNAQPKQSLAEWVLARYATGQTVPGFTDAFFSPTLVNDLGDALEQLFTSQFTGVLNVAGTDRLSKFEFARRVLAAFELDADRVVPSTLADMSFTAQRPHDLSLDVSLALSMGLPVRSADAGIARFVTLRDTGYADSLRALTQKE